MPFYADVDTTPDDGGSVSYRHTTDPALLQRAMDEIQRAYPHTAAVEYLLIATWDHVGYFKERADKVAICLKIS